MSDWGFSPAHLNKYKPVRNDLLYHERKESPGSKKKNSTEIFQFYYPLARGKKQAPKRSNKLVRQASFAEDGTGGPYKGNWCFFFCQLFFQTIRMVQAESLEMSCFNRHLISCHHLLVVAVEPPGRRFSANA